MCFSAWCDNCNSYFSFDNDDVTKLIVDPVKKKVFAYCPKCKQKIRLPLKKGTHTVKCPNCNNRFEVKCKKDEKIKVEVVK